MTRRSALLPPWRSWKTPLWPFRLACRCMEEPRTEQRRLRVGSSLFLMRQRLLYGRVACCTGRPIGRRDPTSGAVLQALPHSGRSSADEPRRQRTVPKRRLPGDTARTARQAKGSDAGEPRWHPGGTDGPAALERGEVPAASRRSERSFRSVVHSRNEGRSRERHGCDGTPAGPRHCVPAGAAAPRGTDPFRGGEGSSLVPHDATNGHSYGGAKRHQKSEQPKWPDSRGEAPVRTLAPRNV